MGLRKSFLIVGFALIVGLAVWAQAGGLEALLEAVRGLLGEKGGQTFLDFIPLEGKAVESSAPQELAELDRSVTAPGTVLLPAVRAALPEKAVAITQAFLLPPKEAGTPGKEFQESKED